MCPDPRVRCTNSGEDHRGLLVGRLRVVNPLVPTSMDVVAALVWWAMALLVVSVLVAFVVRVTRRRRARSGAAPTKVGG